MEKGVLLPNGDVQLCCMDFGLKHKLGNLNVDTYLDLYHSKEFLRVMEAMSDESEYLICRKCAYARKR